MTVLGRGRPRQCAPAGRVLPFHTHLRMRVRVPSPPHILEHCRQGRETFQVDKKMGGKQNKCISQIDARCSSVCRSHSMWVNSYVLTSETVLVLMPGCRSKRRFLLRVKARVLLQGPVSNTGNSSGTHRGPVGGRPPRDAARVRAGLVAVGPALLVARGVRRLAAVRQNAVGRPHHRADALGEARDSGALRRRRNLTHLLMHCSCTFRPGCIVCCVCARQYGQRRRGGYVCSQLRSPLPNSVTCACVRVCVGTGMQTQCV